MTDPDHGDALDGPAQIGVDKSERPKLYITEVSPDGKDWEQLSLPFPIDGQSLTLTIRAENMLRSATAGACCASSTCTTDQGKEKADV